jgi:hypothetical protein
VKHIAENMEDAEKLMKVSSAGYGDFTYLTIEDVNHILQGKVIVYNSGEYGESIMLDPDIKITNFNLDVSLDE